MDIYSSSSRKTVSVDKITFPDIDLREAFSTLAIVMKFGSVSLEQ